MRATYSPEDNKLRVYPDGERVDSVLDEAEYAAFKRAGFKWAAKQECFVAPRWTPAAEDWALELADEIEDEDYSALERSADRAERFEGYRDKRAGEAGETADRFDAGPAAFGHQNRTRAERQAARHDRLRGRAVSQWSKAEYWQRRTAGVISHALYRAQPTVRRSRIKRLEAEQRAHEKSRDEYAARYAGWQKVATLEGADQPIQRVETDSFIGIAKDTQPAGKLAYVLANGPCWGDYVHPRTGAKKSLYSLLTDPADPITPAEASALWLDGRKAPDDDTSSAARWSAHYELRLTYERTMLENEGGAASDAEMVPGGWISGGRVSSCLESVPAGWKQIQAVNKSNASGRVVSVKVWGVYSAYGKPDVPRLVSVNVERLPEGAYRPPTADELEAFKVEQAKAKAERKAATPKAPPLINPTDDDAQRLQDLWNAAAAEEQKKRNPYGRDFQPVAVLRITQAQYAANSKGHYARFETRTIHADGRPARRSTNLWSSEGAAYDKSLPAAVCKVRVAGYQPLQVIILTDKPQKPLPIDWSRLGKAEEPAPAIEKPTNAGQFLFA